MKTVEGVMIQNGFQSSEKNSKCNWRYWYWLCCLSKLNQNWHCTSMGPQQPTGQVWSRSDHWFQGQTGCQRFLALDCIISLQFLSSPPHFLTHLFMWHQCHLIKLTSPCRVAWFPKPGSVQPVLNRLDNVKWHTLTICNCITASLCLKQAEMTWFTCLLAGRI